MTLDELEQLLSVGRDHACWIDVRPVPEAPGYVRTVIVLEGHDLLIEFEQWGLDEGGLYYRVSFNSLAELVACAEIYLGRPLASWQRLSAEDYPPKPSAETMVDSHRQWPDLLTDGGPVVPRGGRFYGSSCWLGLLTPER